SDGSFLASVSVDSTIAGFSLGNALITFGNHNANKTLITTLQASVDIPSVPSVNVQLNGYWDATKKYDFKGTGSVMIAGLSLANGQFEMSDLNGPASFTFTANCNLLGVFTANMSGSFLEDANGDGGFVVTSTLNGTILGGPHVNLSGQFDSHGNYDFKGT